MERGRHPAERLAGARLGALIVAVVALLVVLVPICHDDMSHGMAMTGGLATSHTASTGPGPAAVHCQGLPASAGTCPGADVWRPPAHPAGPSDVLMVCVVFLLAIAATVLGPMMPGSARIRARSPGRPRLPDLLATPNRRQVLAELCVLRT